MKTNRRGFLKGSIGGLAALFAVDPRSILQDIGDKPEEPEVELEPEAEEELLVVYDKERWSPYFQHGGVSIRYSSDFFAVWK